MTFSSHLVYMITNMQIHVSKDKLPTTGNDAGNDNDNDNDNEKYFVSALTKQQM